MTYEYICTACGHAWEAEQAITASPLKKCPSCGKNSAQRQISGGTGFLLKGGGWYADGYGSSPPKASDKSSADSSAESKPAKADKATESKPAKKDSTETATPKATPKATPVEK